MYDIDKAWREQERAKTNISRITYFMIVLFANTIVLCMWMLHCTLNDTVALLVSFIYFSIFAAVHESIGKGGVLGPIQRCAEAKMDYFHSPRPYIGSHYHLSHVASLQHGYYVYTEGKDRYSEENVYRYTITGVTYYKDVDFNTLGDYCIKLISMKGDDAFSFAGREYSYAHFLVNMFDKLEADGYIVNEIKNEYGHTLWKKCEQEYVCSKSRRRYIKLKMIVLKLLVFAATIMPLLGILNCRTLLYFGSDSGY